ncbi:MAG: tetratricopeptide repeat protein [Gammaproteobacteria bacterium]|nr:tetratricopeptide repeat protein [Gammaproteobacteria bacterium]MDD9958667.1 tetratricopeptide repeat protein [Gammaproteobacteria bacterium]
MALNAAEEETIESLKKWWEENGKQLLLTVIAVLAGYTSWLLWTNSQSSAAESASDMYEEILALAIPEPGVAVTEDERANIVLQSDRLIAEHTGTVYAQYGALYAAQQHVADNDLAAAEASLQWVIDNPRSGLFTAEDEGLMLSASLRLARVVLAQGEAERALSIVNNLDPKAYEAGFAELRGDIYVAMGRPLDARDSYVAAQQAGSGSDSLRMKLDELPDES